MRDRVSFPDFMQSLPPAPTSASFEKVLAQEKRETRGWLGALLVLGLGAVALWWLFADGSKWKLPFHSLSDPKPSSPPSAPPMPPAQPGGPP